MLRGAKKVIFYSETDLNSDDSRGVYIDPFQNRSAGKRLMKKIIDSPTNLQKFSQLRILLKLKANQFKY